MASSITAATRLLRPRVRAGAISTSHARLMSSEHTPRAPYQIRKTPSDAYTDITHPDIPIPPDNIPPAVQADLDRAQRFILPVYSRPPVIFERGRGVYVWDALGRRYLDLSGGIAVNALGHADPEWVTVLAKQASTLAHASNLYHNQWAPRLAELLVRLTQREGGLGWAAGSLPPLGVADDDAQLAPAGGAKVFFSNSGTEANEGALKVARKVGKERWARARSLDDPLDFEALRACPKVGVVCFAGGFHGRSMGALSATPNPKYQAPFAPLVPGFRAAALNDFDALGELVDEETCGVIVEPIQGEGGINVAQGEWLEALRKRCDEVGAVLIFDEIQCGLYRSGTLWAHSALPPSAHPDIITMAKPLANGYPIGAVLMRDSVAETMGVGSHGTTFGGSALACAVGHHVLRRLSQREFVTHIQELSAYMVARLSMLQRWYPGLVRKEGVRGRGLILGIPFRDERHPGQVVRMARERGVLLLTAGTDVVRLVPSLNISKGDVDVGLDVIESCLGELS